MWSMGLAFELMRSFAVAWAEINNTPLLVRHGDQCEVLAEVDGLQDELLFHNFPVLLTSQMTGSDLLDTPNLCFATGFPGCHFDDNHSLDGRSTIKTQQLLVVIHCSGKVKSLRRAQTRRTVFR